MGLGERLQLKVLCTPFIEVKEHVFDAQRSRRWSQAMYKKEKTSRRRKKGGLLGKKNAQKVIDL